MTEEKEVSLPSQNENHNRALTNKSILDTKWDYKQKSLGIWKDTDVTFQRKFCLQVAKKSINTKAVVNMESIFPIV